MTTTTEVIDGRLYRVTRDDENKIIRQAAADPVPIFEAPDAQRARQMLAALTDKVFRDGQTLTPLERDRVAVATIALLRRIST